MTVREAASRVFFLPERLPAPSPRSMRCLHFWLAVVWLVNIPIAVSTGLVGAVVYIGGASIYANLVGHWSGWSAERPTAVEES